MNFFKNLHPLLRTTKNENSNSTAGYALLQAIGDSLTTAETLAIQSKVESFLNTATGSDLDTFGSWFGVYRSTDQSDDSYRQWIHDFVLLKRGTVNAIIHAIKTILDLPNANISIYEPYKNMFTLDSSYLDGDDHLEGDYYRYAIITINIDQAPSKELVSVIQAFKPAGVIFWINSILDGDGSDDSQYKLQINPQTDVHSWNLVGDDFNLRSIIDPSYANQDIITGNIFQLDDSYLDGKDVLGGDPNIDRTLYSSGIITKNTITGIKNNFDSNYLDQLSSWSAMGTNLLINTSSSSTNRPTSMQGTNANMYNPYSRTDSYEQVTAPDSFYVELYYRPMVPDQNNLYGLTPGETYTLSGSASHTAGTLQFRAQYGIGGNNWSEDDLGDLGIPISDGSVFTPFSHTFTIPVGATGVYISLDNFAYTTGSLFRFNNMKLEKGSVATPWCPNPSEFSYVTYSLTNSNLIGLNRDTNTEFRLSNLNMGEFNFDGKNPNVDYSAVGTNLYTDTKNFNNLASGYTAFAEPSVVWTKTTDTYNGLAVMQTTQDWDGLSQYIQVKKGDILTYSAYAKNISGTGTSNIYWQLNFQTEGSYNSATTNLNVNVGNAVTITDSWQRVSGTVVATSDGYLRPRLERSSRNTNTLQIAGIKVEKGSEATPWCPSLDDIRNMSNYLYVSLDFKDIFYNRFTNFIKQYVSLNSGVTYDNAWKTLLSDSFIGLHLDSSPNTIKSLYNFSTNSFDTIDSSINSLDNYVSTAGYMLVQGNYETKETIYDTIFSNLYLFIEKEFEDYYSTSINISGESEEIVGELHQH